MSRDPVIVLVVHSSDASEPLDVPLAPVAVCNKTGETSATTDVAISGAIAFSSATACVFGVTVGKSCTHGSVDFEAPHETRIPARVTVASVGIIFFMVQILQK